MKVTVLTKGEKVHGTVESIVRRINKNLLKKKYKWPVVDCHEITFAPFTKNEEKINERKKSQAGKKGSSKTVRAESGEVSDRIQE